MDFWEMTVDEALSGAPPATASAEKVLEEYAQTEIQTALALLPEAPSVHQSPEEVDANELLRANESNSVKRNQNVRRNAGIHGDKSLSLNKAYFDVKKFVISGVEGAEKEEAKVRLAMSLGAKPKKKKYTNYKNLKEERKEEKKVDKGQHVVKSGKVKKRKGKDVGKRAKTKKTKKRK